MNIEQLTGLLAGHELLNSFERSGLDVKVHHVCACGEWNHEPGGDWRLPHRAHVAEVLMPAIREALAQEIEALPNPYNLTAEYANTYGMGIEDAARIVRGGTP